jgi:hypothetical protein
LGPLSLGYPEGQFTLGNPVVFIQGNQGDQDQGDYRDSDQGVHDGFLGVG